MWAYDFMQHALIAGTLCATICALVSILVMLRRTAFAAHALGHMSLTGAAGSVVLGIPPLIGQLVLNLLAAIIMGLIGNKINKNDLAIGVVLSFILGLGAYFLFLFQNNYAGGTMSILFGNILTVSVEQIWWLAFLAIVVAIVLIIFGRQLIFASMDPVIAASKNIPVRFISILFFLILALTVSMACQIVGALLVFVLLIIPGAIAFQWSGDIYCISLISIIIANLAVVFALSFAYWFNLPVSFCITMFLSIAYFFAYLKAKVTKWCT